jgi:hypothetical protein
LRSHLAPLKCIRCLEFAELPTALSGGIRGVELRDREDSAPQRSGWPDAGHPTSHSEAEFPELKG